METIKIERTSITRRQIAIHKEVRTPQYRKRIEKPKKGKGSYSRKDKEQ